MGNPAATLTSLHSCPMSTPGMPPIPHVGGPIMPPGALQVLIGTLPGAAVSAQATCIRPPDSITKGSCAVFYGAMPAARMGDMTAHGGSVVAGVPTVLIGG